MNYKAIIRTFEDGIEGKHAAKMRKTASGLEQKRTEYTLLIQSIKTKSSGIASSYLKTLKPRMQPVIMILGGSATVIFRDLKGVEKEVF